VTLFNSIKTKILFVSIGLVVVPLIVTSLIMSHEANTEAARALQQQVANQLVSIREIKKAISTAWRRASNVTPSTPPSSCTCRNSPFTSTAINAS
jgi:hypothetical protein